MKPCVNAALDAEPAKRDDRIQPCRFPVPHDAAETIDVCELCLEHVEAVWRSNTKTDVALEVSRVIFLSFLTGTMLRKVFCGSHDKLQLVYRIGHHSGFDCLVVESVDC